jgi:hypothetical protein
MKKGVSVILATTLCLNLAACETTKNIARKFDGSEDSEKERAASLIKPQFLSSLDVDIQFLGIKAVSNGWFEYQLVLTNKRSSPIQSLRGVLTDESGNENDAASDPTDITKVPKVGENVALLAGASVGSMALAFAGVPFVGIAIVGGVLVYQTMNVDDNIDMGVHFIKTSLTGKRILGKDQIKGSFYFPAVKPTKIKIGYSNEGGLRNWVVFGPNQEGNLVILSPQTSLTFRGNLQSSVITLAQLMAKWDQKQFKQYVNINPTLD